MISVGSLIGDYSPLNDGYRVGQDDATDLLTTKSAQLDGDIVGGGTESVPLPNLI